MTTLTTTTSNTRPLSTSFYSTISSTSSSLSNSIVQRKQKKKMSITQTYYLAHTARRKLTKEAARADHDLRLLVGHANLLDSLMLELADAEQEQERWFNQTVNGATKTPHEEPRHIQWAETVVEDPEEDWDPEDASDVESDTSDDSDYDEEEEEDIVAQIPQPAVRRRAPSPVAIITEHEVNEEDDDTDSDFEYDDAEYPEELALTRSSSRQSPPELSSDSDEESEDDSMPPSPPQPALDTFLENKSRTTIFDPKHVAHSAGLLADSEHSEMFDQGFYASHQEQSTVIEAY